MRLRFFRIDEFNEEKEMEWDYEELLMEAESEILPRIGERVIINDSFPRKVVDIVYGFDKEKMYQMIDVCVQTNKKFEKELKGDYE